jgi:hypothetical protein
MGKTTGRRAAGSRIELAPSKRWVNEEWWIAFDELSAGESVPDVLHTTGVSRTVLVTEANEPSLGGCAIELGNLHEGEKPFRQGCIAAPGDILVVFKRLDLFGSTDDNNLAKSARTCDTLCVCIFDLHHANVQRGQIKKQGDQWNG